MAFYGHESVTFKNDESSHFARVCVYTACFPNHSIAFTVLLHILGDKTWSLRDPAIGQRSVWPCSVHSSGGPFPSPLVTPRSTAWCPWAESEGVVCPAAASAGPEQPPRGDWIPGAMSMVFTIELLRCTLFCFVLTCAFHLRRPRRALHVLYLSFHLRKESASSFP